MSAQAGDIWLAYNVAENASDYEGMMRLVAPDLAVTVNGQPAVSSAADDERAMRELKRTYPDYHRVVDEVLSAGDRAVARWQMVGTPTQETTPALRVHGCSVVRVRHGVMTEAHLYYDGAALDAVLDAAGSGS